MFRKIINIVILLSCRILYTPYTVNLVTLAGAQKSWPFDTLDQRNQHVKNLFKTKNPIETNLSAGPSEDKVFLFGEQELEENTVDEILPDQENVTLTEVLDRSGSEFIQDHGRIININNPKLKFTTKDSLRIGESSNSLTFRQVKKILCSSKWCMTSATRRPGLTPDASYNAVTFKATPEIIRNLMDPEIFRTVRQGIARLQTLDDRRHSFIGLLLLKKYGAEPLKAIDIDEIASIKPATRAALEEMGVDLNHGA